MLQYLLKISTNVFCHCCPRREGVRRGTVLSSRCLASWPSPSTTVDRKRTSKRRHHVWSVERFALSFSFSFLRSVHGCIGMDVWVNVFTMPFLCVDPRPWRRMGRAWPATSGDIRLRVIRLGDIRLRAIRLGVIRLTVIRLGAIRLGDVRLRDSEGQNGRHRRISPRWKGIKTEGPPVLAFHLRDIRLRLPPVPAVSGTSLSVIRLGDSLQFNTSKYTWWSPTGQH